MKPDKIRALFRKRGILVLGFLEGIVGKTNKQDLTVCTRTWNQNLVLGFLEDGARMPSVTLRNTGLVSKAVQLHFCTGFSALKEVYGELDFNPLAYTGLRRSVQSLSRF
jgi:hypothetical protein